MESTLVGFGIFALLGMGAEIVFTGLKKLISDIRSRKELNWSLPGYSFVWVMPLYGSAVFLFPPLFSLVEDQNIFFRALAYGISILCVELVAGILLKLILGKNPWHYESGWTLGGFVRLDYLPFWMIAGIAIEFVYVNVLLF
jgi:hypothetical protein